MPPYNPAQSRPSKTALTARGRREPPASLPSQNMQRQPTPAACAAETATSASTYRATRGGAATKNDQPWCSHRLSRRREANDDSVERRKEDETNKQTNKQTKNNQPNNNRYCPLNVMNVNCRFAESTVMNVKCQTLKLQL